MKNLIAVFILIITSLSAGNGYTQSTSQARDIYQKINDHAFRIEQKVIAWRREIHANPELGNREFRTSRLIAEHLTQLGLEVQTGIAYTGVVAILKGKKEGPVVAIRADMDALPVKELVDLPFASKVTAEYNRNVVPVMHACGHDAHVAILMGVAEILAGLKDDLHGTVKFIFQPAEDSKPDGEEGGAGLMIKEGVLENPKPDAILGLHVVPYPSSAIAYRPGGIYAAVDNFTIKVKGRQSHGAFPWAGIDPVTTASQIVLALQTIVSRQIDITEAPAVITVGTINGGVQQNIVPGEVTLKGTVRTFSATAQKDIHRRIVQTAQNIAESAGASAEVEIFEGVPVVYNDPDLTALMKSALDNAAGDAGVIVTRPITVGDDFGLYTNEIPGFYFLLGTAPEGADPNRIINHSPYFEIDEPALVRGVIALGFSAVHFLENYSK